MAFDERIVQFAARAIEIADEVKTEEATKASLVMPFFQLLGYDIFDPREFIPEYTADVGIKKGERVDYAIIIDGQPLILLECKPYGECLDKHLSQLYRYFTTIQTAKFGILTDGITYRFYTDLQNANILDDRPFLEINLTNLKDSHIRELGKFRKSKLDIDNILNSAETLMYENLIKEWLTRQLDKPDDNFIVLILNDIYAGKKTQKAITEFRPIIESSIDKFQVDLLNSRFRMAIKETAESTASPVEEAPEEEKQGSSRLEISMEEIEAFAIVKAILHNTCDINRLTLRPTDRYTVVDYDGNSWKRIIRFWLRGKTKYVTTPDENKTPVRHDIENINDLYTLSDTIREVCGRYV
jgi:hypothetical protein